MFTIDSPKVGNWHLVFSSGKGAYFAQIIMKETFRAMPEGILNGSSGQRASNAVTLLRVLKTYADRFEKTEEKSDKGGYISPLKIGTGAFTIESVVKGVLADGSLFERNILRSVYNGNIEPAR